MSRFPVMLLLALLWVIIVLFTAGCTAPVQEPAPQETLAAATVTTPVTAITVQPTPPVTTATPAADGAPDIHVDGYWTYPQGRDTTENPVPLMVHIEAFNTGTQDARDVRTSANFYYGSRMICFNTIFLGTLAAGGHVSRDSMVTCTLPSPFTDAELEVRFENTVIAQ